MDFSDIRDHLERECTFPLEQETLVDRFGDVALDTPTDDGETIATVLSRTGTTTYRSAEEVHATLVGTVGDAYVGPKYYDDRGGADRSVADPAAPRNEGSTGSESGTQ